MFFEDFSCFFPLNFDSEKCFHVIFIQITVAMRWIIETGKLQSSENEMLNKCNGDLKW